MRALELGHARPRRVGGNGREIELVDDVLRHLQAGRPIDDARLRDVVEDEEDDRGVHVVVEVRPRPAAADAVVDVLEDLRLNGQRKPGAKRVAASRGLTRPPA